MEYGELIQRIQNAAKSQRVSQTDLAKIAGLPSQSAMSNVFKGKRRLTIEEAGKLRAHLQIDEGPPVHLIPVIGLASAGQWNEAVLMPLGHHPVPRSAAGPRSFAVVIKGDSMDRLLPEGGWAVVDPDQRRLYAGRVYLIQNEDHEATVKRYCGDPARFEPVSNNPEHQPFELGDRPYAVIGRVVSYGNTAGL